MEVSLDNLPAFAAAFAEGLPRTLSEKAFCVGLVGELGAGKTTFVQSLARALGAQEGVRSPTFVIAQVHSITRAPFTRLVHIDAYRLHPTEKDTIGLRAYTLDPTNLVVVEWPENLSNNLTLDKKLEFTVKGEDTREIIET